MFEAEKAEKEMPASAATDTDISANENSSTDILHPESDFVKPKPVTTEIDGVAKALDEAAASIATAPPDIIIDTAVARLEILEGVAQMLSEHCDDVKIEGKYADNRSGRSEIKFTANGESFILQIIRGTDEE